MNGGTPVSSSGETLPSTSRPRTGAGPAAGVAAQPARASSATDKQRRRANAIMAGTLAETPPLSSNMTRLSLPTFAALAALFLAGSCRAAEPAPPGPAVLRIDPAVRHQTVDGWGTCLTSWLPQLAALYQDDAFADYYADDLGCNVLRINLWPGVCRPARRVEDVRYQNFDFTGDGGRLLVFRDFAKKLRQRNPDALLIGTVWSPPAWMKRNHDLNDKAGGAITGDDYAFKNSNRLRDNRLNTAALPAFAAFVVEMVRYFDHQGVPLDAVSIANEPQFTQPFESCLWTADDWAKANRAVGEALDAAGYAKVKLFGPETMTGFNGPDANPLYVKAVAADEYLKTRFGLFATHGYSDGFHADASAKSAWDFWSLVQPTGKPYWITEGGTGGHDWPQPVGGMAMCLHNALVWGNASAVVPWQVSEAKPSEGALMVMGEPTAKTHVARQYFHFVRPGAARIDATPSDTKDGVHAAAFVHDANRTLTLVLVNTSDAERQVTLDLPAGVTGFETVVRTSAAERSAALAGVGTSLALPPQSVTTLQTATGG